MKTRAKKLLLASAALAFASLSLAAPAVVVNPENAEAVDGDKLSSILLGKQKFWDNGSEVLIAVLKGNGDASSALEQYAKMDESRFKSHWQRLAFSGRGTMPKQVESNAELLAFVQANKGAIGIGDTSVDLSAVKKVN